MKYRIGIDVGGTFTDFLLVDEEGSSEIYKVLGTPDDPSIATMAGLEQMAQSKGMALAGFLAQVELIVHGTTITTNLIISGEHAKTGFITTKGFRDYYNERRGMKRTIYTPKEGPPRPIVPRYLVQGVEERVDCEGKVFIPLKEDDVYKAIEVFKKEKVETVAISFFFSFVNPSHEQRVKEIIEREMPGIYVCASHEVLPQVRIYERASTTVFNAALTPGLRAYIGNLTGRLGDNGFHGVLRLMQSNGGVMTPETAMDFAVGTLLSGPAGGPKAGVFYAGIHDIRNIITIDMGGTSFDSCLIHNREPEVTVENEVCEYKIAIPSLDIRTMGAGGGSIAWLDHGILKIGPQSAGAFPGPACYGQGQAEPTVSDANLILGYLNPDYFLGGRMKIYPDKAEEAVKEKIAVPLGLDVLRAAWGIYTVVNINMAAAVRLTAVSRGYDPRECALVIAGGAGPLHACDIAKSLEIPLMMVPKASSVFCATGMLISDLRHDYVRVYYSLVKEGYIDIDHVNVLLQQMREEGLAVLTDERIPPDKMLFSFSADLRYEAQVNEIEVSLPLSGGKFTLLDLIALQQAFDEKHFALYGYNLEGTTLEMVCLRLKAEGITEKPKFKELPFAGEDASKSGKGDREIFYKDGVVTAKIYDGDNMGHGNKITGPAIIEEPTTTIFVAPDYQASCDKHGNYLMFTVAMTLEDALNRLRR
ncbi:hydantoinase/oxoprolinase family protein [Chloroflexota bacterium]